MSRVVVLTGGVGGAKLVLGLQQVLPPDEIVAIVNTGDDFTHLGLAISPDIDTLLYTLAGKSDPVRGWGVGDESWHFMESLRELGGEDWFQLGDRDLALHVLRTAAFARGDGLAAFTASVARAWGIGATILPMSEQPVATWLETDEGALAFQHYFVARRCEPCVSSISFQSAQAARPGPGVIDALTDPGLRAILIAPSNPYLSIDPVLAVPGIRQAISARRAPAVAVSPIVGGKAVKGPTAKLMGEMGIKVSALSVAQHYVGLIDAILVDEGDPETALPVAHDSATTLMITVEDKARVARAALALADRLA